jgi:hypothetical protein
MDGTWAQIRSKWAGIRGTNGRTRRPVPNGRAFAAWLALLFTTAIATYAYAATGGASGRQLLFLVVVLLLSGSSSWTAAVLAVRMAANVGDVAAPPVERHTLVPPPGGRRWNLSGDPQVANSADGSP